MKVVFEAAHSVAVAGAEQLRNEMQGIDRLAVALVAPTAINRVDAQTHPALITNLKKLVELTGNPLDAALAAALLDAAGALHWYRPYASYAGEADIDALREGYFAAALVENANGCSVFFTVQAPGLDYPSHVHKAPEMYHPVAGRALWQWGGEPFAYKEPGAWIHHPSGTRHAIRTVDQPLLAMVAWTADLDSESVIVRA